MKRFFIFLAFIIFSICISAQKDTAAQNRMSEILKPPVDSNILIVIDGTVAGTIRELKKDISKTFPVDMIESVEVLKGFRATDKYGDKGKAGVIEFYLKNVEITEKENIADSVFSKVEIEASFPGGENAWRKFLEKTLNANVPSDSSAPEGTYTVLAQFTVDRSGVISDVKALTNHGFGMEQEVIRVIRMGPNWVPAMKDGKPVKAYRKQPVTFQLIVELPFKLSASTIEAGQSTIIEIKKLDYVKDKDIEVTLSYGSISHIEGKKYLIIVDKPGKITLTVTRKAKKKKDQYLYGTVEIKVE